MIVATAILLFSQEIPKQADLNAGELVRLYERTMSRRGTFDNVLVLTMTKAFRKNGDGRQFLVLSDDKQKRLKAILNKEPVGLRSEKRANPMWPSAYDGSDQWMAYRVGKLVKRWGNNEFTYPTKNCPLTALIEEIKAQLVTQ